MRRLNHSAHGYSALRTWVSTQAGPVKPRMVADRFTDRFADGQRIGAPGLAPWLEAAAPD